MKNHYRAPQTGKYGNIIGILKEMFNCNEAQFLSGHCFAYIRGKMRE